MDDLNVPPLAPAWLWPPVFFVVGAMVGSFLNVCIHRLPRDLSVIHPPSHCPACGARIPWLRNLPLVTWLAQRGRGACCGARIPSRYVIVEALTGLLFLATWFAWKNTSPAAAVVMCVFLAGLVAATFIDFEHLIIPDVITLGGTAAGVVASVVAPAIQGTAYVGPALLRSLGGAALGAGLIYAVLRLGKLLFGRQRLALAPGTRLVFTEDRLVFPDHELPYEEIFYRRGDTLRLHAARLELVDRCHANVPVRLRLKADELWLADEKLSAESVKHLEVVTDRVELPREAMGPGDVKFMAAIGAFIGWQGVLFTLVMSSLVGAAVGVALIAIGRRDWSSRIPYGPYLALAAAVYALGARQWVEAWWMGR
ncbi:MAG: prepilin peptidase [Limisphaerales bacterium]